MAHVCANTCVSTVLPLTRKRYLQALGDGHQVKQECFGLACAVADEVEEYLNAQGAPQHDIVKDALTSIINSHIFILCIKAKSHISALTCQTVSLVAVVFPVSSVSHTLLG